MAAQEGEEKMVRDSGLLVSSGASLGVAGELQRGDRAGPSRSEQKIMQDFNSLL